MNKIFIRGRLTRDPEARYTKTGKTVTSFSVAVNRRHGDNEADFFDCEAWNGTADIVSRYLAKGSEVAICGEMRSEKYEAKDGSQRRTWRLVVDEIEFCGKAQEN